MADTTFVPGTTITSEWLNDINDKVYGLSSTTDAAKGAGQVGFLSSLPYFTDTVGYWLKDVAAFLLSATGAVARTLKGKVSETISVTDFMTEAQRANAVTGSTPTLDSSAAFKAAWDHIKTRGGTLLIPPGNYLWNAQVVADVTSPVNLKIEGTGATIYCGAAVTGSALQVSGAYNQFGLDITGLTFNMRGNSTAQGCFEVLGGHNVKISRCTSEQHGTKAGWYFAKFSSKTPGASEDDWNSFWCGVYECNTRMRSGGDGTPGDYGVLLEGATNAFESIGNIFSDVNEAIKVVPAPTTNTLPNAIVIERNSFESITSTAVSCVGTPAVLGPTGWRIAFNRVETCPTFVSFTTGGAAMTQHSQPPLLLGNYCTAGSVTTWLNNPTNYQVSVFETRSPGFGPSFDNRMWQAGSMKFNFADGGGLALANGSGGTDYETGWLSQGTYYYWTNTGVGKFYVKPSAPTNNTDGTVVGTQT